MSTPDDAKPWSSFAKTVPDDLAWGAPQATDTPTPKQCDMDLAWAYGGAFTAFDVHGCAVAIRQLVERELAEAKREGRK